VRKRSADRAKTVALIGAESISGQNHYLMGGTGKYKGITGTVPYTVVGLHETVGGRTAWIVNHKATWELK
jgi:hypothetical protein